jgi:hypothetical protein
MYDRRRERHGRHFLDDRREAIEEIRREVEPDVRYANIATIEGTGA